MTGRRKKRRRKTEERESGGGQRSTVGGNLIPIARLRLRRKHRGQKGRGPFLKASVPPAGGAFLDILAPRLVDAYAGGPTRQVKYGCCQVADVERGVVHHKLEVRQSAVLAIVTVNVAWQLVAFGLVEGCSFHVAADWDLMTICLRNLPCRDGEIVVDRHGLLRVAVVE